MGASRMDRGRILISGCGIAGLTLAIALKPSTFLSFHRAMVQCKY